MIQQSESAILKFSIQIFYVFGFWPKAASTPRYLLFSFLFNSSGLLIASMTINLILLDNISDITNSLVTTLTGIAYLVKTLNFYFHRDSIKDCITELSSFEHGTIEEASLTSSRKKLLNYVGFAYYINLWLYNYDVNALNCNFRH